MYNKKIPVDTCCGVRIAIEVIGGKWKPYIIDELMKGSRRPSELMKIMPEANRRVVSQQLKELTEYGVIEREVVDAVKKHSEYRLTERGKTLTPIISAMRSWGEGFRPQLREILDKKEFNS